MDQDQAEAAGGPTPPVVGDLVPGWVSFVLFRVWPAIMLLQWILVVPLASWHDLVWHVDTAVPGYGVYSDGRGLLADYFFVAWNVLPFILQRSTWRFLTQMQSLLRRLHAEDGSREAGHWGRADRTRVAWAWGLCATAALAAVPVYASWLVQNARLYEYQMVYWWHVGFSPAIWWIRMGVVLVNAWCLILLVGTWMSLVHVQLVLYAGIDFRPRLGHHDGASGLSEVGGLSMLLTRGPAFMAVVCVLGLLSHEMKLQLIGDIAGLAGFALVCAFVLSPLLYVHRAIRRQREGFLQSLSGARVALRQTAQHLADQRDPSQAGLLADQCSWDEAIERLMRRTRRAAAWPFDVAPFAQPLRAALGAAALFGLQTLLTAAAARLHL